MKYKLLLLVVVYLSTLLSAFTQTRRITGRVLDAETIKPVANATVIISGTTKGTTTNHLGFFSLDLDSDATALVISCIGYVTSKIDVPSADAFKVMLSKEFVELKPLDLAFFEFRELSRDTARLIVNLHLVETSAEYPGGWEHFYNDLGGKLKTDSLSQVLSHSIEWISFTVDKEGIATVVNHDLSSDIILSHVRKSFNKMSKWQPAIQNKAKVPQHFKLPLKWTKNISDSTEEIFTIVEIPATPKGGMNEFYKFVAEQMRYPLEARQHGISGRVFVEFVIDTDGSINDVRVVKGIGYGCDEEAVRAVSLAPKWIPGTQKGVPVKQRMVLPITFRTSGGPFTPISREASFGSLMTDAISYPTDAKRMGIEGWVVIKFNTNKKTGEIKASQVLKDIGGGCAKVVIDGLKVIPKEIIMRLHQTRETFVLPVSFGLDRAFDGRLNYVANESEVVLEPVRITVFGKVREVREVGNTTSEILNFPIRKSEFISFEDALLKEPKTQRLSFVARRIKKIPTIVGEFANLLFLDLENNEIESIPPEFTKLKKLQELYLPFNKLAGLPDQFGELRSLKILGLGGNRFDAFPMVLTELEKLEALDLAGNQITSLPAEISKMKKLKSLFLQNNRITHLPKGIYELKNLEKLYLSGNPLDENEKELLKGMLKDTEIQF